MLLLMKQAFLFFYCMSVLLLQAQNTRFEWAKSFNSGRNMSNTVATDAAGNVYTAGLFTGTVNFDPGPSPFNLTSAKGYYDAFLCKRDGKGNLIWALDLRKMGDVNYFDTIVGWHFNSLAVHPSTGDIYIGGLFTGTIDADPGPATHYLTAPANEGASFVCKFSTDGKFLWAKQVGGQKPHRYFLDYWYNSNVLYDWFYWHHLLEVDASGNVYFAGMFEGTRDFDPSSSVFNLKGTSQSSDPSSQQRNEGFFIVKLDAEGSFAWACTPSIISPFQFSYGGLYGHISGADIETDDYGNLYCVGNLTGTVDFDPSGIVYPLSGQSANFVWKLSEKGSLLMATMVTDTMINYITTIKVDKAANIYVTGSNYDYYSEGSDAVVAKLNPNGGLVWTKPIGKAGCKYGDSHINASCFDTAGNLVVAGIFWGKVDFDPGPGEAYHGDGSLFILSLKENGNFYWARTLKGTESAWFSAGTISLSADKVGNIYTSSYSAGTPGSAVDLHHGAAVLPFTLTGDTTRWGYVYNSYIHKMSPCNGSTRSSVTVESCSDYQLNHFIYTTSGQYTQTISNTEGCDSIITLNLTIKRRYPQKDVYVSACKSYSWYCRLDSLGCWLPCRTLSQNGTYVDTIKAINTCDTIVNLHLTILPPILSTLSKSICQGQSYLGYKASGTYTDTFTTDAGCDSIRILQLTVLPVLQSTFTKTVCYGQTFLGYNSSGTFIDSFKTAAGCDSLRIIYLTVLPQVLTVLSKEICSGQAFEGYTVAGVYMDTLTSFMGCDSIRQLNLTVQARPLPELGANAAICKGDSLVVSPGRFDSYLWQDGSTGSTLTITKAGLYKVEVTNRCGTGMDDILITEQPCNIYFPSAFTPNSDGRNDAFKILSGPALFSAYRLTVFNRWGQKVFETTSPSVGWDGQYGGRPAEQGAYVWHCTFRKAGNTNTVTMKGTVTVIR